MKLHTVTNRQLLGLAHPGLWDDNIVGKPKPETRMATILQARGPFGWFVQKYITNNLLSKQAAPDRFSVVSSFAASGNNQVRSFNAADHPLGTYVGIDHEQLGLYPGVSVQDVDFADIGHVQYEIDHEVGAGAFFSSEAMIYTRQYSLGRLVIHATTEGVTHAIARVHTGLAAGDEFESSVVFLPPRQDPGEVHYAGSMLLRINQIDILQHHPPAKA